jgi:hypothetical protein
MATATGWVPESGAADQLINDTVCDNCADPVLDQSRYTFSALSECLEGLEGTGTVAGLAFPFTHDETSPCRQWASYFAWLPTDDKIGFSMCGREGHNGPGIDCVGVVVNYTVECLFDLDIFGIELCYPVDVDLINVETIAPNGHRDSVVFPVHDDGRFFGPLPRTDPATLPYANGARGDGTPTPSLPPGEIHPPHIGHQRTHYGFECTNLDWRMN